MYSLSEMSSRYFENAVRRLGQLGVNFRQAKGNVLYVPLRRGVSYGYRVAPNHSWSVGHVFSVVTGKKDRAALHVDDYGKPEHFPEYGAAASYDPIHVDGSPGVRHFADALLSRAVNQEFLESLRRLQSPLVAQGGEL